MAQITTPSGMPIRPAPSVMQTGTAVMPVPLEYNNALRNVAPLDPQIYRHRLAHRRSVLRPPAPGESRVPWFVKSPAIHGTPALTNRPGSRGVNGMGAVGAVVDPSTWFIGVQTPESYLSNAIAMGATPDQLSTILATNYCTPENPYAACQDPAAAAALVAQVAATHPTVTSYTSPTTSAGVRQYVQQSYTDYGGTTPTRAPAATQALLPSTGAPAPAAPSVYQSSQQPPLGAAGGTGGGTAPASDWISQNWKLLAVAGGGLLLLMMMEKG